MDILNKSAIIERIKSLAKEKGYSLTYMYKQLYFPSGYLRDVNANKTALTEERLNLIADFLGTTIEYLKGETDIKEKAAPVSGSDLSDRDIEFLKKADLLNPVMQRLLIAGSQLDAEDLERLADLAESLAKAKAH